MRFDTCIHDAIKDERVRRLDPTGTAPIRRLFLREMAQRHARLKRATRDFLLHKDSLGLGGTLVANHADSVKLQTFARWMANQVSATVVQDPHWMDRFVLDAYNKGAQDSSKRVNTTAIRDDDHLTRLTTLGASELTGIAHDTVRRSIAALHDNLSRKPVEAFRAVAKVIDTGGNRGDNLVNVLAVSAHAVASLDNYAAAGKTHVGIKAEHNISRGFKDARRMSWNLRENLVGILTAGDDDVCDECEAIEADGPYSIPEAYGLIPAHPNCRCAVIPWDDADDLGDSIRDYNPNHEPAGSPTGGQFAPAGGSAGGMQKVHPVKPLAKEGSTTVRDVRAKIRDAERQSKAIPETWHINTPERQQLRDKIVNDLYTRGITDRRRERKAVFITGLPASGKSTLADPLVEKMGALEIDPDLAKVKLPEYANGIGAAAVHEESSLITKKVLARALQSGDNFVWPRVNTPDNVVRDIKNLQKLGYTVEIQHLEVPLRDAMRSAIQRFLKTGRYVSPRLIEKFGTKPLESYHRGKEVADSHKMFVRDPSKGPKGVMQVDAMPHNPKRKMSDDALDQMLEVADPHYAARYQRMIENGEISLSDVIHEIATESDFNEEIDIGDFDPNQPRDPDGKWASGSGSGAVEAKWVSKSGASEFFHGSSVLVADKIAREGIVVQPPENQNFEYATAQHEGKVFFADTEKGALAYGVHAARATTHRLGVVEDPAARRPVVFRIEIPASAGGSIETYWEKSNSEGNAYTAKRIPPEWIKSYTIYSDAAAEGYFGGAKSLTAEKTVKLRDAKANTTFMCIVVDESQQTHDADWDPAKHPRAPAGTEEGGQFAPAGGPGEGGAPTFSVPGWKASGSLGKHNEAVAKTLSKDAGHSHGYRWGVGNLIKEAEHYNKHGTLKDEGLASQKSLLTKKISESFYRQAVKLSSEGGASAKVQALANKATSFGDWRYVPKPSEPTYEKLLTYHPSDKPPAPVEPAKLEPTAVAKALKHVEGLLQEANAAGMEKIPGNVTYLNALTELHKDLSTGSAAVSKSIVLLMQAAADKGHPYAQGWLKFNPEAVKAASFTSEETAKEHYKIANQILNAQLSNAPVDATAVAHMKKAAEQGHDGAKIWVENYEASMAAKSGGTPVVKPSADQEEQFKLGQEKIKKSDLTGFTMIAATALAGYKPAIDYMEAYSQYQAKLPEHGGVGAKALLPANVAAYLSNEEKAWFKQKATQGTSAYTALHSYNIAKSSGFVKGLDPTPSQPKNQETGQFANYVPTPGEIEKAKSTVTLSLSMSHGNPDVVNAQAQFNKLYTGEKTPTTQEGLVEKVKAFKHLQSLNENASLAYTAQQQQKQADATKNELGELVKKVGGDLTEAQTLAAVTYHSYEANKFIERAAQRINSSDAIKKTGITPTEAAAIMAYSDGHFTQVNAELRAGAVTETNYKYMKLVNKALDKLPPFVGLVKRGTDLPDNVFMKYKTGMIVNEHGFTSTSHGQGFSGPHKYHITSKNGRDIRAISEHQHENEILFKAGTHFKVEKVSGSTIYLQEVD